ncbi:SEC-C metal-binding domain-containing protein [Solibacillus sp. FSL W7-1464]|uniref:SEC-C metal-binding domain-containing protein n=1 Tax=Solibacillus sp. FSL W7-1464 TaxID=2921706 RepID=UPI0030F7B481
MTIFIEKVRPFLFSDDEVLRHAWLLQLHDYPAVPVELVNDLIVFCRMNEVTRKELLMDLENSPKNEQSIELLLQWIQEIPLKDKKNVVRFLLNVEPRIIVKFKSELMSFLGREYIELCEKLLQYEFSDDEEFEPLWELYGEYCNVVERNYNTLHLAFLKHIINALIRLGEYDEMEARLVIADSIEEDFFSINGLMAVYAAGVMQEEELIPYFVELMHIEDDELGQLLQETMIRLQSEEMAKAMVPYLLSEKNGMYMTASAVLKEAKTQYAEQALADAYKRTSDIDMKEFFLDALTSHLSPKAFPLIENFLGRNEVAFAFDMDEMFYSFYKAMGKEHPSIATWRVSVLEQKERFEKDIESFLMKDIIREQCGKIGRNDPCICGSGKKFKKCCG